MGLIGYAICTTLAVMFPDHALVLRTLADAVFLPLAGIGIAHKIDKIRQVL